MTSSFKKKDTFSNSQNVVRKNNECDLSQFCCMVIFVNLGYTSLFCNRLQKMFHSDVVKCVAKRDIIEVTFLHPHQQKLNKED